MQSLLRLLLLILFTALAAPSQVSPEIADKIDGLFASWNKPNSPGCAVGVLQDGKLVFKKGYGFANLEQDVPIRPNTVFHIASDSKQFTAFAVLMLARQGKLSLDDDIRKHLPELTGLSERITIRHLIHHTGGIRDQWQLLRLAGIRGDDVITSEHILKLLWRQRELNFKPGEKELYSNSGYTLLAEIVARVSRKSFTEFTRENIFRPLGMMNTHFHDDHRQLVQNRADSYLSDEKSGFRKATLSFANVGATNLMTTVEDLAKWIKNFENPTVGDRDLITRMYQGGVLNSGEKISYAFGLMNGEYNGLRTIGHGGGDAGFRSYSVHFPQQRFAVLALCNVDSVDLGATWNTAGVTYNIADIFLAERYRPLAKNKGEANAVMQLDSKFLNRYVGSYRSSSLGTVVNLTNYYGTLMMWEPPGNIRTELVPVSQTEFIVKRKNGRLRIEMDAVGNVARIVINGADGNSTAVRLPPRTRQQLAEYVGRYYSPELDTSYEIVVEDGQLIARHWRNEDTPLSQIAEDLFKGGKWYFDEVHFLRDENHKIGSFRVSTNRVKNLLFERK